MEQLQVKDLRIGNNAQYESGLIVEITNYLLTNISLGFTNLYPIQLTKEILLKCGFEKNEIPYFESYKIEFDKYHISIQMDNNLVYINDGERYEGANIMRKCYYLHELQNLIFALTGNELEIKI